MNRYGLPVSLYFEELFEKDLEERVLQFDTLAAEQVANLLAILFLEGTPYNSRRLGFLTLRDIEFLCPLF